MDDDFLDEVANGDRCYGCGIPFDTPGDGHVRTCRNCDTEEPDLESE
jgi:hypothetical protein